MVQNTLAIVISYYRDKYGFTLERLSSGICSVTTLSRIEAGVREIDSLMAEALLGRIGKEVTQFEIMLNDEDYAMWQRREAIHMAFERAEYNTVELLLEEYRKGINESQTLHQQWYLFWCAKLKCVQNKERTEVCELAEKALRLTVFEGTDYEEQLFNPVEIQLILMLIQHAYADWGMAAEEKLEKLFGYVERIYSDGVQERLGTDILLLLVKYAQKQGDSDKVLLYAERAISFIAKGRGIRHVAELHFVRAKAILCKYRNNSRWETMQGECKEACMTAYCTAKIMEETDLLEQIEKYCEENLAWQITKQGILFV